MQDIFIKQGTLSGPVSVILAGVHGNEPCGIRACESLVPLLEIQKGTVYFIVGNPRAVEQYLRSTEQNLNRMFQDEAAYSDEVKHSYEFIRSREIMKYLDQASALLDIHSAAKHTEPFMFCESASFETASYLPADFKRVVSGVDAIEPGGTDGYMHRQGKIGICIECGQHEEPEAIDRARKAIECFLVARGHVISKMELPTYPDREQVTLDYVYLTKTDSFALDRKFRDFEIIEEGTLIGKDESQEVRAPYRGRIVFARSCKAKGLEGFLMGKID